jgi:hypothetical protein
MITLEDCNCNVDHILTIDEGLSTLEKIYFMARGQPVDLVEGEDGVFRKPKLRGWADARGYGHLEDCLNYTKWAGISFGDYSGIWINNIGI